MCVLSCSWHGLSEGLHTRDGQKASSSFPVKKTNTVKLAQLPTPLPLNSKESGGGAVAGLGSVAGGRRLCRVLQPWGGDCEVGTVAPAFCVLATHEWSQLTKYHPGLRSDEERHVFPPTEDLWLRLTSGGQDTNCELGVGRGMTRSLPPVLWGAALPGWTGVRPQARCVEPTLGLAVSGFYR